MKYVIATARTSEYGGPEEGGWYFDRDVRLKAIPLHHRRNTNKFIERMKRWLVENNYIEKKYKYHKDNLPDDYEMSDDEFLRNHYEPGITYFISVENALPPKVYPIGRPHYE